MKRIGVTQRVDIIESIGERRDALDQNWSRFLSQCDLIPVFLPNDLKTTRILTHRMKLDGFLLTGGNSLAKCGGDAPERDAVERWILKHAARNRIPVIGVCRGMQMVQDNFGHSLVRVQGHIQKRQKIKINGKVTVVNSFHNWGTRESRPPLQTWARAKDGVIKAIRHESLPIHGIMWHPERFAPFRRADCRFFQKAFKS